MSRAVHSNILKDSGIKSITLALGEWRKPNIVRPMHVVASVLLSPSVTNAAEVHLEVDRSGGESPDDVYVVRAPRSIQDSSIHTSDAWIPRLGSYRFFNVSDPLGGNQVLALIERIL